MINLSINKSSNWVKVQTLVEEVHLPFYFKNPVSSKALFTCTVQTCWKQL